MSNNASPAQRLSLDIIHRVLPYAMKKESIPLSVSKFQTEGIYKLLVVSSTWRQAALEYLWSNLNLAIYTRGRRDFINFPEWIQNYKLTNNTAGLVNELCINIFMTEVANGAAYKIMVEYMRHNTCFPVAQKLSITILCRKIEHAYPRSNVINNTIAFVQLLKSLTPAATAYEVNCPNIPEDLDEFDEQVFVTLTNSICRHTKSMSYNSEAVESNHFSTAGHVPHISSLSLCCKDSQDSRAVLVHKYANILYSLEIGISDPKALLYDSNDNAVTFPHLQRLTVFRYMFTGSVKRLLVPNVVPFPILRKLKMWMPFLFGDDVIFRGNSATLEDLNFYIDKTGVMMLNSSRAFCHKYTSLRKVVINDGYENESLGMVPDDAMSKFLYRLAYSAQRLTLSMVIATDRLLSMSPRRLHFEYVQELDLHAKSLSLYAILNLLMAAPTIIKLICDVSGLGSGFGHIVPGDIPDYIVATYGAAGKNLKTWVLPSVTNGERSVHITEYYMLVALVCPRLYPFGSSTINLPSYHATIVESLQNGPYSKYASRLVRLIHGVQ